MNEYQAFTLIAGAVSTVDAHTVFIFAGVRGRSIIDGTSGENSIQKPSSQMDNFKSKQYCVGETGGTNTKKKIALPDPYTGPRLLDGKLLHCYYCDYSFKYKSRLIVHIVQHFPPKFPCKQCGKKFRGRKDATNHMRRVHSVLKLNCPFCDFSTKYPLTLKNHGITFHGTTALIDLERTVAPQSQDQQKCVITSTVKTKMMKQARNRREFPPPYNGPRVPGDFNCYYCPKGFQRKIAMESHMSSHRPLEFFCKVCGYGFTRIDMLRKHHENHFAEKKFRCVRCNFDTKYPQSLRNHISLMHGQNSKSTKTSHPYISCFHCGWTTKFKCRLIGHLKRHRPKGESKKQSRNSDQKMLREHQAIQSTLFSCNQCGYTIKNKYHFKHHMLAHRPNSELLEGSAAACHLCDYKGAKTNRLTEHLKTHSESILFQCPHCSSTATGSSLFAEHLEQCKEPSEKEKFYICQLCKHPCETAEVLLLHVKSHRRERSFKCPHCESTFFHRNKVMEHIQANHPDIMFQCKFCGYKTKYKSSLTTHVKAMHERSESFKCRFCEYQSFRKSTVRSHEGTHNGEKKYACDLCDFRTRSSHCLKKHQLRHEGDIPRPLKCELCDYRASSITYIKRHVQGVHNTERPFNCSFCSRKFKTQQTAYMHEKGHLGKKRLQCSKCAYTTVVGFCLQRHMATMHPARRKIEDLPDTFPNGRKKKWYLCQKCAYRTCGLPSMKNHMKIFHPKGDRVELADNGGH